MQKILTAALAGALLAMPLVADAGTSVKAPLVVATVNRATQEMTVTVGAGDDTQTYGPWKVSTARAPYKTPAGTYPAAWLSEHHWSKEYHAPMPFAVFFNAGRAVHAATRGEYAKLGTPASHGCVRTSLEHAQIFFELVKTYGKENAAVVVQ